MLTRLRKAVVPGGPAYRRGVAMDVVGAAGFAAASDVLCQVAVEGVPLAQADTRRVVALAVWGATYTGGFCHHLYRCYPVLLGSGRPLACSLLDNVHCGALYIPAYFVAVGLMQGGTYDTSVAALKREWWYTATAPVSCYARPARTGPQRRPRPGAAHATRQVHVRHVQRLLAAVYVVQLQGGAAGGPGAGHGRSQRGLVRLH